MDKAKGEKISDKAKLIDALGYPMIINLSYFTGIGLQT